MQRVLKPLHMRYARRINRERGWKAHLWQGRFFSSPLGEAYLWAAIRYVERNPVRAKMVAKAEDYPWSSAAAHCGLKDDAILSQGPEWKKQCDQISNWSAWLTAGDEPEKLEILRRNIEKGLPCGAEKFIRELEKIAGRSLCYCPFILNIASPLSSFIPFILLYPLYPRRLPAHPKPMARQH